MPPAMELIVKATDCISEKKGVRLVTGQRCKGIGVCGSQRGRKMLCTGRDGRDGESGVSDSMQGGEKGYHQFKIL